MNNMELLKAGDLLHEELPKAIPTGFPELDKAIAGWRPGTLSVIGGRHLSGKSTFAIDCAINTAKAGIPTLFFSLQMSSTHIVRRMLERGIPEGKIPSGELSPELKDDIEKYARTLVNLPLYVDDTPGLKSDDFEENVKDAIGRHGIQLVFIDYVQLMQGPEEFRGKREEELSYIVRMLKTLSRSLEIPIVILSLMPRKSVQRTPKTPPTLADFQGSQELGTVPDNVLMIYANALSVLKTSENGECLHGICLLSNDGITGK